MLHKLVLIVFFIELTSGVAWAGIRVGGDILARNTVDANSSLEVITGDDWKAIDTSNLFVKAGTALDFSSSAFPAPAGVNGRVIINKQGGFAFENAPDQPIRFHGFVLQPMDLIFWPETLQKKQLADYADAVVRQGYNFVRLHMVEDALFFKPTGMPYEGKLYDKPEDLPFVAESVDYFNYLLYCLKQRGVYVLLDVYGANSGYTGAKAYSGNPEYRGGILRQRMYSDPQYRANWKAGVTRLLTLENPYTKTRLADDPMIAVIHLNNEQHLTWSPEFMEPLNSSWRAWVKKKYRDAQTLCRAWPDLKLSPQNAFEQVPSLSRELAQKQNTLANDMNRFVADLEIELNAWYEQVVRRLGYKGLINNWNCTVPLMRIPPRAALEVVATNNYYDHPTYGNHSGSTLSQKSQISAFWDPSGRLRFLDRPFVMTEYGHVFWSQYRHEQGIRIYSYAAFQDWNGICVHASAVAAKPMPMKPFYTGLDPVIRASEVYSHFAYGRGYVSKAKQTIEYPTTDGFIFAGHAHSAFDLVLSQLCYICKSGITYEGKNNPAAVPVHADLKILPAGGAILTDHGMFETVRTASQPSISNDTLETIIKQMRKQKIIPAHNLTDVKQGIFQTDTGEITAWMKDETMTVITPRLEAVAIKRNKPVRLNKVQISGCSVPSAVSVITLNEKLPITQSNRLLVIFNTDALNSRMSFTSKHRNKLVDNGKLPVLMKTGKLSLTIENQILIKPTVYALKLDGTRVEKIPVEVKNSQLILSIDTARLAGGPTPFFEITQE
jgi:hypothetical protein